MYKKILKNKFSIIAFFIFIVLLLLSIRIFFHSGASYLLLRLYEIFDLSSKERSIVGLIIWTLSIILLLYIILQAASKRSLREKKIILYVIMPIFILLSLIMFIIYLLVYVFAI